MPFNLQLVPACASTVLRVQELVPYTHENVQRWGARMIDGIDSDVDIKGVAHLQDALQAATVLMRDNTSGAQHRLLTLPVAHAEAVAIQNATTGAGTVVHCFTTELRHRSSR